uniref:AB hydrolase-1 domain-containing protein n=1 Tax=Entamoeba invadens TaxID=33085 RepID=S0B200_ENTIV|nr:hypothetical protein, conserved [Entamoeba invadens]
MKIGMLLQFYLASLVAQVQTLLLAMRHNRPYYYFTSYVVFVVFSIYNHIPFFIVIAPLLVFILSLFIATDDFPHMYYMKQSPFSATLIQKTPKLQEPYKCPLKVLSGHLLTTYTSQRPSPYSFSYTRVVVNCIDGGVCGLDILDNDIPDTASVVLLVPGAVGDTKSLYIKKAVKKFSDEGFRPIVLIKRGLSGLPLKTPKIYNALNCEDIHDAVKVLHQKCPNAYVNVVGYSLGASQVVRLSYQYSSELLQYNVNSCAGVCVPWGLSALDIPDLYSKKLAGEYVDIITNNKELFENVVVDNKKVYDLDDIKDINLTQLEQKVITPMFGYKSVEAYHWDAEQWFQNLPCTKIPTFTINSFDDPVCNDQSYSYLRVKAISGFSPFVITSYTQRGGHCIFSDSMDDTTLSYADGNVSAFIKSVEEMNKSGALANYVKDAEDQFKWINE